MSSKLKKRKLSALSGMELEQAYNSVLKLKKVIAHEASQEKADPNEPAPEDFEQQSSKLEGPQV
jgi:hypothetical protein